MENMDAASRETLESIFDCLKVKSIQDYRSVCKSFEQQSLSVQKESILEVEQKFMREQFYFHDRFSMVIFKLSDMENNPLNDYDLILTAGDDSDPNALASGFLCDRQFNRVNKSTLTFYFNYDRMLGLEELKYNNETIRKSTTGMKSLGIRIQARPEKGFIQFAAAEIKASEELLNTLLKPNACTLIEIKLHRLISQQVFQFEQLNSDNPVMVDFKNTSAGSDFIV